MNSIKTYYRLTKPGIIYGNLITALAGFFLGAKGHIHSGLLLAMCIGTSCIIASACVFNNYIDRDIDKKMERTKKRAFVTGTISVQKGLIFACALVILGVIVLGLFTNVLTLIIGCIGFVDYVFLYTFSKRHSIQSTLIGSISGATPIVAGYVASTNRFDLEALLLFLILAFWQMPHFYAIAIYRLKEYAAAGVPVLSVKKGIFTTKVHILFYTIGFFFVALLLSMLGYTGHIYFWVMLVVGLFWIGWSIKGLYITHDEKWARKMFFFSLIIIMVFSVLLSLDAILVAL